MVPPVAPINKVFDGDFSTEGAMEDGGRSPENSKKGNSQISIKVLRERSGNSEVDSEIKFGVEWSSLEPCDNNTINTRTNVSNGSTEVAQLVVEDDSGSRRKNP